MWKIAVWLVALSVVLGGCGPSTKTAATTLPLTGNLTVFAAASLTEAFTAEKATLASKAPHLTVTYSFAGSQALVTQIQQGAPADVFASADQKSMQKLVDAGLVDAPRVFARNKLEIVVAPGNPKHITGLADLAQPGLVVVLEDPSVPAGAYSRQALQKAGVTVKPKSLELDVKSTLAKVTSGEADAAIVYVSDVQSAGTRATGVAIPDAQNVVATYPVAVVKASKNHAAATAFVDEVVSGSGQAALRHQGFLAP
ncbi:MAG TPA: molybdate ABC transporter substrate-binding protein [Acidimicrobiales bacterium]|nr:molybdate ABC transporter substrate-binding protein [Acidimicrobiales bacterium]